MKILIVEDESKTAAGLIQGLREQGFDVEHAADGERALQMGLQAMKTAAYDLIVLDVMLPGRDGLSVLAELRKAGCASLFVLLTAKTALEDRVSGLEMGADAYLGKPFAFSELVAVIQALLRRSSARRLDSYHLADLELDLIQRECKRAGQRVELTAKEFSLLALLAKHAGETISREQIFKDVWNIFFDTDTNIVDVHIRRLRSKVDDPFERKLIHTVRGIGYVLRE